jgi:hypothetical protein
LVVTTCDSPWSSPKAYNVAHVVLVLVPNSINTKEGGSYFKFGKVVQ